MSLTTVQTGMGGTGRNSVPAYFHGYVGSDTSSLFGSSPVKAPINTVTIDTASGFNTSTNLYTVPAGYAGYYQVTVKGRCRNFSGPQSNNANQVYGYLFKNGSNIWEHETDTITGNLFWTFSYTITGILQLAVGDTLGNYAASSNSSTGYGFRGVDTSMTLVQLYGV